MGAASCEPRGRVHHSHGTHVPAVWAETAAPRGSRLWCVLWVWSNGQALKDEELLERGPFQPLPFCVIL